ncbi:hypothetical protein [Paractinoplanes brasiliensis]|uniref:Uncharacterized protein n=1 Tax=Paractinoplanes brasiliensis TaxID=52695 RepID=A0A4R6JCB4_9ACTN|nr:hypothetical protein [Actinoplanes brasiliensis]TDO32561.1 hypothetical protein C8E87_8026 [Actinoplanes brasiliensis]GID27562.1 hypothetical protein Abr02nite_25450 [Actinoplanes brasiliensis]
MSDDNELTSNERAVLLVLMSEGRQVSNTELAERYGFRIPAAIRDRLKDLGLLDVVRSGSAYLHEVSDPGWKRGGTELLADFEVPARPPKMQVAAWKALAHAAGRYLAAAGVTPSEFFSAQPAVATETVNDEKPADLEGRIRAAYQKIADRPNQSVPLSDLREQINGAPVSLLNQTLVKMYAEGLINLTPGADQKSRRKIDEQAAVRAGGEAKHFLSMEL